MSLKLYINFYCHLKNILSVSFYEHLKIFSIFDELLRRGGYNSVFK